MSRIDYILYGRIERKEGPAGKPGYLLHIV